MVIDVPGEAQPAESDHCGKVKVGPQELLYVGVGSGHAAAIAPAPGAGSAAGLGAADFSGAATFCPGCAAVTADAAVVAVDGVNSTEVSVIPVTRATMRCVTSGA